MCICISVFGYDDAQLELGNLVEDFRPIFGLISTPSGPFSFESITMKT
jgi:hypothetical protein